MKKKEQLKTSSEPIKKIGKLARKSIYVYGHPDDVNTLIEIANHFDVETIRLGA